VARASPPLESPNRGHLSQNSQRCDIVLCLDPHTAGKDSFRLGQRAIEDFTPFGDQEDAIAKPLGVLHYMRGEQNRMASSSEVADNLLHHLLVHRVQPGKRLVQNDELGVVGQTRQHLDFLAHALGKSVGRFLAELFQAIALE